MPPCLNRRLELLRAYLAACAVPFAFLALTAEIEYVPRNNRELLSRGHQATRDLLAAPSGGNELSGYGANGQAARLTPTSHLVDQAV